METYKQDCIGRLGYVVYRDLFPSNCSKEKGILAHKVAVFVSEDEAQNYCDYRNRLMQIHGTDSLEGLDGLPDVPPCQGCKHQIPDPTNRFCIDCEENNYSEFSPKE